MSGFEYFDHTADVGLRVSAESFGELLTLACRGMSELIVPQPKTIRCEQQRSITLDADEPALMLFDLLNEILYLFDVERLVFAGFEIELRDDGSVDARITGETFDPDRHPTGSEVKAVTYHDLNVEQVGEEWRAEVVFDI